ncbi:hypothetical protein EVAR_29451_1 [Eumeta japonica]|uniref:Uncharacterized protein n=1 Tax=Eumeta variegata TaxID=151549 RepID=A0A4C1VWA1_EUMVA|nr:hypothetical protein EVAR_29451_1 [Eumeta japonica]
MTKRKILAINFDKELRGRKFFGDAAPRRSRYTRGRGWDARSVIYHNEIASCGRCGLMRALPSMLLGVELCDGDLTLFGAERK